MTSNFTHPLPSLSPLALPPHPPPLPPLQLWRTGNLRRAGTISQLLVSLVLFDYFCLLSNKYILHWLSVRLCYFLHPNSTHLPVYPFHLHISIRRIHQILVLLFCRLNL